MIVRDDLRAAAKGALKLRAGSGYALDRPCDVYELIVRCNLELQFFAVPTLEGMYLEDASVRRVCVSALRPAGRQRFTAAHELGHSMLRHGTKLDSVENVKSKGENRAEELSADTFASYLLMPRSAVEAGFKLRGLCAQTAAPVDIYRVATWLGVGYATLCRHLAYPLSVLPAEKLKQLVRCRLRDIKCQMARALISSDVFDLDDLWANGVVHAQVGDIFRGLVSVSSRILTPTRHGMFLAKMPGETDEELISGARVHIRVSRQNYVGFYDYRYLPQED